MQNLNIVKNKISKKSKNIFLVNQVHSNRFIFLNNIPKKSEEIKADAIITNLKKLPIAVLTADCVPVLLYENEKKMVAVIHAGWKGAVKGIISKVINFMKKKGCKANVITAAVGPSIAQKSYEVKEDFKKKFLKKDKSNNIFFKERNNQIYFNLPKYVKSQLKLMKISKIETVNIDTFDKKNNFFSARQSLNSNHDDYGRNISLIMIN